MNPKLDLIHFRISSTLVFFDGKYYEYHGGEIKEQGLAIGGYESAFLANLVASYIFDKSRAFLNLTTYHVIYSYDGLVVFKGKKSTE